MTVNSGDNGHLSRHHLFTNSRSNYAALCVKDSHLLCLIYCRHLLQEASQASFGLFRLTSLIPLGQSHQVSSIVARPVELIKLLLWLMVSFMHKYFDAPCESVIGVIFLQAFLALTLTVFLWFSRWLYLRTGLKDSSGLTFTLEINPKPIAL